MTGYDWRTLIMPLRGLIWSLTLWLLTGSILGSPWRFSNPRPHGNQIYDMIFRDGVVWQVGDRGSLHTSADLDHWTSHETGTRKSLRGLTFLSGNVFISGEEGTILSGASPGALRLQSLPTTNWLEGIAASASTLVAVGDNGAIYSSSGDGNWIRRGSYTTWLRGVCHGGNEFLCVGEDGFIARSADGETWQSVRSGTTAHLNKVSWVHGAFWVLGDQGTVLTNNSQMEFSRVNLGAITNTLFTISANSTEVVIAGDSAVLLRNPLTGLWSPQADADSPTLAPLWPYYSSLWDGRLFLLGGQAGMIVEGFRTNATAPLVWYSDIQPTRSWLWSVTRAGHLYAAVGVDGAVITSDDGVEWAREVVPPAARGEVLLGIGGNTNLLLAAGSNGTLLRSQNAFTNVVSTNSTGELVTNRISLLGIQWNEAAVATTQDLQGVAVTDQLMIVTGGGGTILTSADGVLWQPRISGVTSYLSGVTPWRDGFVSVGAGGVILTSADGLVWARRNSGVQDWVYAVRWLGGKLIAVGENGVILTSDNGIEWTRHGSGASQWLNDVAYAGGTWFVAGSRGTLVTSSDGRTWTATKAITSNSLYGAAAGGEQVVLVGMEGTVLRSTLQTPSTPVNILGFDHVGEDSVFLFAGMIDQQFVLEESTSLTAGWTPAASLELTDPGGTLIYEHAGDNSPTKFFRTRLLQAR
jgi:hypothetical protein